MALYRDLFLAVLAENSKNKPAEDITGEDAKRVARYSRNLKYYLESQYDESVQPIEEVDWTSLESIRRFVANLTSAISEVVNLKSAWIYGKGATRVIGLKGVDPDSPEAKDSKGTVQQTLRAVQDLRAYSDRDTWDIISAMNGCIYGDFFRHIVFDELEQTVEIVEEDPRFCYPVYSRDGKKMIRFVQHYVSDSTDEGGKQVSHYKSWQLENASALLDAAVKKFSKADLEEHAETLAELNSESVALVYREFVDDDLVDYQLWIGFDEIPWVHGRNLQLTGSFGIDEVSKLVPKIEKLNAVFRYAERVMYVNSHAKVALIGVEGSKARFSRGEVGGKMEADASDALTIPNPSGDAKVLSLPSDVTLMKFVAEAVEKSIYKTASIPPIALADDITTVGQLSGLALKILYGPLSSDTELRQCFYELADRDTYRIALKAKAFVEHQDVSSVYPNPLIDYKQWLVPVPESESDLVNDVVKEYTANLISRQTALEKLGYNAEEELQRLVAQSEEELQALAAQAGIGADTYSVDDTEEAEFE